MSMKTQLARLANLIKSKRDELGLSQSDLARRLGVTQVTVLYWEKERVMPDMNNVKKIAAFLGMSTEELWAYIDGQDINRSIDLKTVISALDTMPPSDLALVGSAVMQKLAKVS